MDTNDLTAKLKGLSTGQKVTAAGAVTALIAVFLPWYSLSDEFAAFGVSASRAGTAFGLGWFGALLLIAAAGLVIAPIFGIRVGNDRVVGEQIAIGLGGVGLVMWLIRLVSVPGAGFSDAIQRGFGLYVAIAAAIAVVVGTYQTMQEQGIGLASRDDLASLTGPAQVAGTTPPPPMPASAQQRIEPPTQRLQTPPPPPTGPGVVEF